MGPAFRSDYCKWRAGPRCVISCASTGKSLRNFEVFLDMVYLARRNAARQSVGRLARRLQPRFSSNQEWKVELPV